MPRKTKQNEITSPELLSQVNSENIRLKQDFIAYLQSVQRSPKTIAGYANDLDIFWVWNLQNNGNKFFPKISKRDYAAYQHWLINENGNSPARVRRLKSAISSLSNYVENILDDEDEFKGFRSTVRKIENPAMQQVRKKTVWSDEALDKLLDDLLASGQNKKPVPWLSLCAVDGVRQSFADSGLTISKTTTLYAAGRCTRPVSRFRQKGSAWANTFTATRWQKSSNHILMHGCVNGRNLVLKVSGCFLLERQVNK